MSEYYLDYTGAQIDDAINKVRSGYLLPTEIIDIFENVSDMDISKGKTLNVKVPVPDNYIEKSQITHFATGIVRDVTAGQKFSVTGITDAKTGEAFDVKGLVAFVEPESTQNYVVSGTGKPAVIMFYRNAEIASGVALAAYNQALTIRANADFKDNDYIVINGNSFYFIQMTTSMYGVQASARWRWIAWG